MFTRRKRHGVPPLNTTSTADISFMLLIFFLVTTSMGADKGIKRELPPLQPTEQQTSRVSESDLMQISVKANGRVECNEQPTTLAQLPQTLKAFVEQRGTAHTFQIACDRDAAYDTYYQVQSALQAAYRQLRNERAQAAYGRSYDDCTDAQRASIDKAVPQRIAEKEVQP